jgi:predicted  nucleic acid-binding Zn-ribbon protein
LTGRLGGGDSFEARVLAELAALREGQREVEARMTGLETRMGGVESRLAALEEKVDSRLRETRPVWEAVLRRLEVIDSKLNVFAQDMMDVRAEVELLKKRNPPAA